MENKIILQNLALNEEYARQILPFIREEYFQSQTDKVVYKLIREYIEKYNTAPTKTALFVDLQNLHSINESTHKECGELIDSFDEEKFDAKWLVDTTEKWCQERALYNALYESISIIEDKSGKKPRGIIPDLLTNALAICFDPRLGHDYIEDAEARYAYFHAPQHKIPWGYKLLDEITAGGPTRKSLCVFMGGPGTGKTMFMCNLAANHLMAGLNVLYITLEMAAEEIAKRIDANMMDYDLQDVIKMEEDVWNRKVETLRSTYTGKIIIQEYPTSCAGSNHFRHLIHELRLKKNFTPDVIYIDYLNICSSSRVKITAGMYQYVLCISEEIRGLAQEMGCLIISATQMNREGSSSSEPKLEHVSQSFGLPATCDFLAAITVNEELAELGQIMLKQLKNRFGDIFRMAKFPMGVDRGKQRVIDVEYDSAMAEDTEEDKDNHIEATFEKFKKKFEGFS